MTEQSPTASAGPAGRADHTRRRVLISKPDTIEVVQSAMPDLAADEALVVMTVSGVCGSDLHAAKGRHRMVPLPYFPGHEVVGVVHAVGADVTHITPGMRVTPEPTLPCGACKMCSTARENICERLTFFGCGYAEGGMADAFTVPARRLHAVPDDLTDLQAVLIEPLATPVHAARLAGDLTGKVVAIFGCGTIGLLMLAAARSRSAGRIVMTDVLASKRAQAEALGADATVDARDPRAAERVLAQLGESADVVFDCVSFQSTVDLGLLHVDKGGTLVIVGVPEDDVTIPLPLVQDHQIRLQGAATYVAQDYEEAIAIIRSGTVTPDVMITSSYPLARAHEAFAAAAAGDQIKVVLTP
jgi:2-desacetyl-2-hydroxyethyl bacteriochlorophyllide A dehydrogenase